MSKNTRNAKIQKTMISLFKEASKGVPALERKVVSDLEATFSSPVWGFREILLVVVLARLIDPDYQASQGLYDCNPRSLYEGPIREVLLKLNIPHRKSGPLNIAKATPGLNQQWAAQRRPKNIAEAVVRLVTWIEATPPKELHNFAVALHLMFLNEAQRVAELDIEIRPESDPETLFDISCSLIDNVADAGNTAQRIVGLLMETYHQSLRTGVTVTGHEDRASVTSTTSKKPGDIIEEGPNGKTVIYEVTTKSFGQQRIIESFEAIHDYRTANGIELNEVLVICRPEDCPEEAEDETDSSSFYGKLTYQDVIFYFVEISEWIMSQLLRMPADARLMFYERLNEYITDPNTAEAVKSHWADLHDDQ